MAKRERSTYERLMNKNWNRKERRELHRRIFSDDPGLEILHPDAAATDIGNESHFVSVPPDRDPQPVREFGSWTADLERMAAWLKSCGIKTVAMQSTGVYWIAAYDVLEKHGFEVFLVNARDTRNVPGRKTDVQESQWLRKLHTYGLLRNSFRPPDEIRAVRTIWRMRDRLVQDAARYVQHMQKALTTMNVQLANAVSDITGLTGQTIIRTILKGERDIYVLADLRDARVKAGREEVARSLEGNWREDVLFELQQAVDAYDFVQKQMGECDRELERSMAALPSRSLPGADAAQADDGGKKKRTGKKPKGNMPKFDLKAELKRVNGVDLTTIDGIDVMTAETILSEIGTAMSRFETERHFVSWAGLTPRRDVSGGKVVRQKSRLVTNRVGTALRLAANALFRSESYLGARFRKLRARRGAPKAIKGMARYLGCLVYRILTHGPEWVDRGTKDFEQKNRQREIDDLRRKAAALGLQVSPAAPPA
ncbi:MAG: IS110 family transposase [Bryobacteraceae bacterium]